MQVAAVGKPVFWHWSAGRCLPIRGARAKLDHRHADFRVELNE